MTRYAGPPQRTDDEEMRGWLSAALAGEPPVPDAVPRVRAAIERRRRRMAASSGVTVLAVIGLTVGGLQLSRPDSDRLQIVPPANSSAAPSVPPSPHPSVHTSPVPTATASPSPSAVATPHLTVTMERMSRAGARDVTWSVRVRGLVPRLWSAQTGRPMPLRGDHLLGTTVNFGDGSPPSGSDGGAVVCHPGAPLVPVDVTFRWLIQHTYAKPGDYTLTFGARACRLGTVTRTARVHVSAPAPQLSLTVTTAPVVAVVGQPVKVTLHTTGFAVDVWPYVVEYGDGDRWVPASVGSHCADPPKPIDDTFTVEHAYAAPGDYTITASDGQCGVLGHATLTIHVGPAPSASPSASVG